jgi:hypothetical protein
MFSLFGAKSHFGVPAGAIYPTTRFPPAFTPRERAAVEAFFGRKDGKQPRQARSDEGQETASPWRRR